MPRTVVFTGPSLRPSEITGLPDALVLPPIKRGDLAAVRVFDPEVIAIIDGEFYQSLAVSPKEILPFLERGVRVYGAASMGALRAVELERCGMQGVGRVFRLFRAGILDAEDEVALAYDPESFVGISDPLINTRYALKAAVREGLLTRSEASVVIERVKTTYFPRRTRKLLLGVAGEVLGAARAEKLRDFLAVQTMGVKEADARSLICWLGAAVDRRPSA
jgi:TfuA protein